MISPDESILICAVRYALGRMSYIVGEVAQYVFCKRKTLSKECIDIIIRDIEEELKRYNAAGYKLGMDCDERTWKNLLEALKGESMCEINNVPIDDLDLSVKAYNCLRRAGIDTIEDLTRKTPADMMRIRSLGRKTLEEIICKMNSKGLEFREE